MRTNVLLKAGPWAAVLVIFPLGGTAAAASAGGGPATAPAARNDATRPAASPSDGLRVFVAGHSFHVFLAKPLETVARAAGVTGHVNAGVQSIGGSRVSQHWDLADDRNKAKQAITAGRVDVLTLSPIWVLPDEGIDRFVDLAVKHNPDARVVVQQSWVGWDGIDPPSRVRANADRDRKTVEQLREPLDKYRKLLEDQVRAINHRHGRPVAFIAPVGDAVLALRERVIAGTAPGVRTQSELFKDPIGHVGEVVQRLAAYTQFAVIYRRSPVGLTAFERTGDEDGRRLDRLLQELAWEAARGQPLSGVGSGTGGEAVPPAGAGATTQPATR